MHALPQSTRALVCLALLTIARPGLLHPEKPLTAPPAWPPLRCSAPASHQANINNNAAQSIVYLVMPFLVRYCSSRALVMAPSRLLLASS